MLRADTWAYKINVRGGERRKFDVSWKQSPSAAKHKKGPL